MVGTVWRAKENKNFRFNPRYFVGGFCFAKFYDIIKILNFFTMNDNAIRHMIAFLATAVAGFAYFGGYVSSAHGWWWTSFGLLIIYGGVYKIVDK